MSGHFGAESETLAVERRETKLREGRDISAITARVVVAGSNLVIRDIAVPYCTSPSVTCTSIKTTII